MKEYSDKEMELFGYFGYENLVAEPDRFISAPTIYRVCVEKAFVEDMKGNAVESLRRCYRALISCKVNRMTPEWDEMIQL